MTNLVLRELPESLLRELQRVELQPRRDSGADYDLELEPQGPLMRALFRAEAELLAADALAMEAGTYAERTPDQRRHDALLLILSRLRYVQQAA